MATHFLGAPFQLRGEVIHGDQRGRELGFPTANLVPEETLACPATACMRASPTAGSPPR